jgi:hypothetical protein
MKKQLIVLGIILLLIVMPALPTVISTPVQKNPLPLQKTPTYQLLDPAPDWAKGNFSGVWGITILGVPTQPLGWINGYYENIGLGKLEAEYADFNSTNATATLGGFMLWIFFFGGVKNIATGNTTWVSGIGVANETDYYLRLNAIIGPSYYMFVQYTKFEQ